jgi:hypothetical protein
MCCRKAMNTTAVPLIGFAAWLVLLTFAVALYRVCCNGVERQGHQRFPA